MRKARLGRMREIKSLQNIAAMYQKQGKTESVTRIRRRLQPIREMQALEMLLDFYLRADRSEQAAEAADQIDRLREERTAAKSITPKN